MTRNTFFNLIVSIFLLSLALITGPASAQANVKPITRLEGLKIQIVSLTTCPACTVLKRNVQSSIESGEVKLDLGDSVAFVPFEVSEFKNWDGVKLKTFGVPEIQLVMNGKIIQGVDESQLSLDGGRIDTDKKLRDGLSKLVRQTVRAKDF